MTDRELKDFSQFCKWFTLRVAHIVVQSRLGRKFRIDSSKNAPDWFNLRLDPLSEVLVEVKAKLGHKFPPELLSACVDILLETADGAGSLCMETWNVRFVKNEIELHGTNITNFVYHRISTLIRSVLCASRSTPCYKYYANRQSADTFVLMYRVRPGDLNIDNLGPDARSVRLGHVGSPFGTLYVSLHYRISMVISSASGDDSSNSSGTGTYFSALANVSPSSRGYLASPLIVPGHQQHRRKSITSGAPQDYDRIAYQMHSRASAPVLGLPPAAYSPSESPDFGYACFSTSPQSGDFPYFGPPSSPQTVPFSKLVGDRGSPSRRQSRGSSFSGGVNPPGLSSGAPGGYPTANSGASSSSESSQTSRRKHDSGSGGGGAGINIFRMELSGSSPKLDSVAGSQEVLPPSDGGTPQKTVPSLPTSSPAKAVRGLHFDLGPTSDDILRQNKLKDGPSSLPFAALLRSDDVMDEICQPPTSDGRPNSLPSPLSSAAARFDNRSSEPAAGLHRRAVTFTGKVVVFQDPIMEVTSPRSADSSTSSDDSYDKVDDAVGGSTGPVRPAFVRPTFGSLSEDLGTFVQDCKSAPHLLKSFSYPQGYPVNGGGDGRSADGNTEMAAGSSKNAPTGDGRTAKVIQQMDFAQIPVELEKFERQKSQFDQFVESLEDEDEEDF